MIEYINTTEYFIGDGGGKTQRLFLSISNGLHSFGSLHGPAWDLPATFDPRGTFFPPLAGCNWMLRGLLPEARGRTRNDLNVQTSSYILLVAGKESHVVQRLRKRSQAEPRNKFQNKAAKCMCDDYFHKAADSQLGDGKRYTSDKNDSCASKPFSELPYHAKGSTLSLDRFNVQQPLYTTDS
ncbi:hypothetical protein TNCV_536581 [Trichonephila clavipes]|nr:hypothetical protein TNCV_536581 [Trichonephila clavipes]